MPAVLDFAFLSFCIFFKKILKIPVFFVTRKVIKLFISNTEFVKIKVFIYSVDEVQSVSKKKNIRQSE